MRIVLLSLSLILASLVARADQTTQRFTPGMSLSLQGQLVDLNAPICSPAAGSYSVAYRNSIATGCSGRGSDDFATLVFAGGSAATYTMPKSSVTTFTGSISGTTLTTPSNAVVVGSVITGVGVLDNTYVTAGSGTSWTVNNSQPVASEILTQSVFPSGHGTCFKNNGTALLTIAATTSTIYGGAGVLAGSQFVLYPGGETCLQADTNNNYLVSGFLPGSWIQAATVTAPVSSFVWTGLSGYPRLHLSCSGVGSVTTSGYLNIQLAYGGAFQTTGYVWQSQENYVGMTSPVYSSSTSTTHVSSLPISSGLSTSTNDAASLEVDFSFNNFTGTSYSNDITATVRQVDPGVGGVEAVTFTSGTAPLTTSQGISGIQLYPSAGTMFGLCWLTPRTGNGP